MDDKAEVFEGNLFWLLSVKKKVNKDSSFVLNFNDPILKDTKSKLIMMYESLVFNEDKEDSLYYQVGPDLFEYFNHDKSDLFYKLMKIHEVKHFKKYVQQSPLAVRGSIRSPDKTGIMKSKTLYRMKTKAPSEFKQTFLGRFAKATVFKKVFDKEKQELTDEVIQKPMTILSTEKIIGRPAKEGEVIANILIMYKDKSRAWIPKFEVKKLPFYWKFIPKYDKIRLIQLYPYNMEKIDSIMVNYESIDNEFDEKDEYKQFLKKVRKPEYEIYENFIKEIKDLFLNKYDLYLKQLRLELVRIVEEYYLIDVDKIVFDKYTNKDPKMKFEKMITCFKEKHINKNLRLTKDTVNVMELQDLIDTMKDVYLDKVIEKCGVPKYLKPPEKDPRADEAFKILKENCPYKFSELLSDDIDKKTFMKYCSNKLIK